MSAKPAPAAAAVPPAAEKPKGGKKMLVIALAAVVVLAGGGGGAWFFMNKGKHAEAAEEAPAHSADKRANPTYLAMENMVVNLADAGGERFAQVGITLDLESDKAADKIKAFMPAIRSGVLMLLSQRTSEELLKRDGKEKLAADIVAEASQALGYEVEDKSGKSAKGEEAPARSKKSRGPASPVVGVLFSSFIIQ